MPGFTFTQILVATRCVDPADGGAPGVPQQIANSEYVPVSVAQLLGRPDAELGAALRTVLLGLARTIEQVTDAEQVEALSE